ncbi:MAG: alpha/beta hydrolase [bacterium]|nr:alpha/beta hydrolase [bacterium]
MGKRIFLHGWNKEKSAYKELLDLTGADFMNIPGFEEELSRPYNLDDYCSWLNEKINDKTTLVTHSFGGRVAIKFVVAHPEKVEKLILIASGGIERKSPIIRFINFLKPVIPNLFRDLFRYSIGSSDYLNATGYLKETLKNVVAENLEFVLKDIKVPTLLIWGDQDHTTPLWHGELMHKLIPNSQFSILEGGDHGIPYRRAKEVAKVINDFI